MLGHRPGTTASNSSSRRVAVSQSFSVSELEPTGRAARTLLSGEKARWISLALNWIGSQRSPPASWTPRAERLRWRWPKRAVCHHSTWPETGLSLRCRQMVWARAERPGPRASARDRLLRSQDACRREKGPAQRLLPGGPALGELAGGHRPGPSVAASRRPRHQSATVHQKRRPADRGRSVPGASIAPRPWRHPRAG